MTRAMPTRRRLIAGVSSGIGIVSILCMARVAAQPPPADALDDARFLGLSKALTGHQDLDARLAVRLSAALARSDPAAFADLVQLARLVRTDQQPAALLALANDAGLGDTARALMAAWYTGTVGRGSKAEAVAYADALMYRVVSDAIEQPTYCLGGPAWWIEPPPSVGVSRPVQSVASPPPTIGTPEPKPL
jgi:fructose 5-dehydrogenase small subunit